MSFIKYLYRTDLERNRTRLVSVLLARYLIGKGVLDTSFLSRPKPTRS